MPRKGKGRGRGRGRDQKKPEESISPGKVRNDDEGHHELQMAAATIATTSKSLETTAKEDQGVCETNGQLEKLRISDKTVLPLPPEGTDSVSTDKNTAEAVLSQATSQANPPVGAHASSRQTQVQRGNRGSNQSAKLGSTTSTTRLINGSGKYILWYIPNG